ncbi:MAG: hypothetical protein V4793_11180 [Paraburkholderia tropica]
MFVALRQTRRAVTVRYHPEDLACLRDGRTGRVPRSPLRRHAPASIFSFRTSGSVASHSGGRPAHCLGSDDFLGR